MTNERELIRKTENMIDELKSICSLNGIGNSPSEYKVISQIFLYKYLNDKFIYETRKTLKQFDDNTSTREVERYLNNIEPSDYSILTMKLNPNVARVKKEYMVSYLFNNQNTSNPEFYQLFDQALLGIANENIDIFSVKTGSKEKIRLFDSLSQYITETDKKNTFFKAIINKLVEFSFEDAFKEKYDFFATIFEYLIKDYNKDFGKYAEYYTPNSIAKIIAKILAPDQTQNVTLYDPSAGSGTLVLALAHQIGEENCTIYTQDISQKSNEFLRLNLILNNLVHSLSNVIHGDTLVSPAHLNNEKNGLAQFDYIVSNPPFKTDFSETRDKLDSDKWKERFFAGVPNVPNEKKDSMAIYLMFIQHIIYSLKPNGKAAIVVPTGFLTAKNGIEYKIRKEIIDKKWLKGIISMPSNIFANTGTNVSIMFLDKSIENKKSLLIDATKLGTSIKVGKIKKIVLETGEQKLIIDTFMKNLEKDDFSINVENANIKDNKYLFNAGQYFNVNFDFNITNEKNFCITSDLIKKDLNLCIKENSKLLKDFQQSIMNFKFSKEKVNTNYNENLKQDIPVGWTVEKLDKCISKVSTGLNPRNHFKLGSGNIKYITVKNLGIDDGMNFENCDYIDEIARNIVHERSDISEGDILFASICPLGRCYLIDEKPEDWDINESVFSIRPNYDIVTSEYLYMIFKHPALIKKLTNASTGSIFKGIRITDLLNTYIPVPDRVTMNMLSKEYKKIICIKRNISVLNKELNLVNDKIIPLIMNGQVTFKD